MQVRTRFAPSPTGLLHIGGVRTALFSWLYARRHGGTFILRVEDTDRERSTQEALQVILDGLAWLGLDIDEGPYYQTRRYDRYRAVIAEWLADGRAYHCYCSKEELDEMRTAQLVRKLKPRYDGRCRNRLAPRDGITPVVRFANPVDGTVVVDDVVHGTVEFQNSELDDLIIQRSDGNPIYNFCVVVDDYDMRITHVIRGDDHLNNTPRQINMLRAMGAEPPVYAHVPMILGPDGTKLSKRHGAVSVLQYREQGFLPEALLNYLVRLGWSHGDQELFTLDELVQVFDLQAINKSASAINPDKLVWINHQHMLRASPERLAAELQWQLRLLDIDPAGGPEPAAVVETLRERARTVADMAQGSVFYYHEPAWYEEKAASKFLTAESRPVLIDLRHRLGTLGEWSAAAIHGLLLHVAEERGVGLGKIAQPVRVAISGGSVSPPIDRTLAVLGRDATLRRLDRAIGCIVA